MSVRKIFPGGMIRPVSIPNVNFSQFQVQSSAFNNLAQRLDRMMNFAVQQGEKVAIEEGKKFAASNPLDADTFYNADPEEREKLVGGDNITSYGRALKIAQINLLATDLSIKAQGDFTKLKVIAVGSNMDADMYEQGLNVIVQGYSDSLLDVDAEAAITVKAQLASKANTLYTSYLDDKIKDYNTTKAADLQGWGQSQLDSIADEIKAGTMRTIEIDGETKNVTIEEFLDIGTEGNPIQELTHGVTVSDAWMQEMIDGDVPKREIWAKVIQRRGEIGYPYIFFNDKANNGAPEVYRDKDHRIHASNLCTEIMLPSNDKWSFVCVLSSINLVHYDRWKNTDAVETMIYFLDALITEFLEKLESYKNSSNRDDQQTFLFMERAYNFAKEHRALGMGTLGWHSLLQSKMLPFDSQKAYDLNSEVFKTLKENSYKERFYYQSFSFK